MNQEKNENKSRNLEVNTNLHIALDNIHRSDGGVSKAAAQHSSGGAGSIVSRREHLYSALRRRRNHERRRRRRRIRRSRWMILEPLHHSRFEICRFLGCSVEEARD